MTIRRFDLDGHGLARVVGELQAQILETVWRLGQATVKEVTVALGPDVHLKTVMTVMNRMVDKELLVRELRERQFIYRATVDREPFLRQVADRVLAGLLADFGRPTLAHFLAEATLDQLAELEQMIAERRRQQEGQ